MCDGHRYPRNAQFLRALSGSGEFLWGECRLSSFILVGVVDSALTVINPLHEASLIAKVMNQFTTTRTREFGNWDEKDGDKQAQCRRSVILLRNIAVQIELRLVECRVDVATATSGR